METTVRHVGARRKLPSLNALRAFEAAARHLSFKEAAEELAVSQSAISHQIKGLEDQLGLPLFVRKTRGIELTRKGEMYYPILRNALDSIAEGTQILLESASPSVLTLQVYSTFTIRWLLPRLSRFQEKYPDTQVRLTTAQADVDFRQNDVDAAIMIGMEADSALHYDHLFDVELFPVCSKEYLHKYGPIATPRDIRPVHFLQVYPSANDWYVWLEKRGYDQVSADLGLQLESYDIALNSAVQGAGVALGQQPYVSRELENGSLVELFPGQRERNPRSWYLVCRKEKRDQPKLSHFRSWMMEEVNGDETLVGFHASG